jgi:hypothetical protein
VFYTYPKPSTGIFRGLDPSPLILTDSTRGLLLEAETVEKYLLNETLRDVNCGRSNIIALPPILGEVFLHSKKCSAKVDHPNTENGKAPS